MAQGRVGITQLSQGDEARQKLQINEIATLAQLMRGGCPIGQALLPVAHQPARHQCAAVGPCLGPAQGRWAGRALHQKRRRIGVILAPHPPRKAFIGQPRIVTQSLRHGIDQPAGPRLVGMQPHPRLCQRLPTRRHTRQHAQDLRRALAVPQEIVQPHLMRHIHRGTLQGQQRGFFRL